MAETTPGYAAALAAAEHHATIRSLHNPAYVAELAAALEQASQFRIPCPGHPYGHLADLYIERRTDGREDGWSITRDHEAWTGTHWASRSDLHRHEIYHYDRQTALDEATRLAPLETTAFLAHIERLRAEHAEPG
jgi:hypothetical protein